MLVSNAINRLHKSEYRRASLTQIKAFIRYSERWFEQGFYKPVNALQTLSTSRTQTTHLLAQQSGGLAVFIASAAFKESPVSRKTFARATKPHQKGGA